MPEAGKRLSDFSDQFTPPQTRVRFWVDGDALSLCQKDKDSISLLICNFKTPEQKVLGKGGWKSIQAKKNWKELKTISHNRNVARAVIPRAAEGHFSTILPGDKNAFPAGLCLRGTHKVSVFLAATPRGDLTSLPRYCP